MENQQEKESEVTAEHIMQVTIEEGKLFYKLYSALLGFVNRKLDVVPERFSDSRGYTSLPPRSGARSVIPCTNIGN